MRFSHVLILSAVVLEFAHWRVTSGNTDTFAAGVEGALANLDEITGSTIRLGYILGAAGIYAYVKGH